MVALLVAHAGACTLAELAAAAQQLSALTQQRMDGLHLDRLVADLQAANATAITRAAAERGAVPQASASAACSASHTPSVAAGAAAAAPGCGTPSRPVPGTAQTTSKQGRPRASRQLLDTAGVADSSTKAARPAKTASKGRQYSALDEGCASQSEASSSMPILGAAPVEVPQSVARHAQRRSRLKVLSRSAAGSNASRQPESPSAASSGTLGAAAWPPAAAEPATNAAKHLLPVSRTRGPAQGPAAAADTPGSLQPAVVFVLDAHMQQLPWESCGGLQHQSIYR